jgi:hypothetical protein
VEARAGLNDLETTKFLTLPGLELDPSVVKFIMNMLWRNRPMWELLKFRNLKERDCATVGERCLALLGCAVTLDGATVRKDHVTSVTVTRNSTRRCVLRMSDSSVYRSD